MRILFATFLFALSAFAADISGEWLGTAEGPAGQMTRTFTFKVDGTKLTGETVSSVVGKSAIDNGQVKGKEISFTVHVEYGGHDMTINYQGHIVNDDKISLRVGGLQGAEDFEWVVVRKKK